MQTRSALLRLRSSSQDDESPEKQFLGNTQYAEELQLCRIPSGSLARKGGAGRLRLFVLRGDGSRQAAPAQHPCLAGPGS